jgi:hypothetical protein
MSGEKRTYVRVEDRELRRLQQQESRLRSVQSDLPERLNAIRERARREMAERLAPLESRQRRHENMIANLQDRIDAIVADAGRKEKAAQSCIADLTKLLEETDLLPHARFAPGQLDDIRRHVSDCRASHGSGMPEAALSTAQRAYWEVADLRALVMQKEREFLVLHQAALQEAREILEEARANRKHQLEFGEGAERDVVELEVDFWTRGELTAHEKQIEELEKSLLAGEGSLTADQVREILARLESLKPQTTEIVEHARQNILSSQLRTNVAEVAAEALRKQMFEIQDSAYEGDDERNAFVVKVRNIAGSEVVAVISPVEGEFGKNAVSIHSYDETYTDDQTLARRAEEIVSILNEEGLQADAPVCAGSAKQDYRDLETVRRSENAKLGKKA